MKYIKTFENKPYFAYNERSHTSGTYPYKSNHWENIKYQIGDQIILMKPSKFDIESGLKKGGIYTIDDINKYSTNYPIEIRETKLVALALYQIRKAKPEEISASKYNL